MKQDKAKFDWLLKALMDAKEPHWTEKHPILKWLLIIIAVAFLLTTAALNGILLGEILK